MKRRVQITLAISGIALLIGALIIPGSNKYNLLGAQAFKRSLTTVWGHYSSVDATAESFGCKEFWISCSDHGVVFEKPDSGKIEDRGTPTAAEIISWKSLDDGRIINKVNSISGLEESYTTTCGVLPDLSLVSALDGDVYFEIFDEDLQKVAVSEISNGNTYTLMAKVDETDDYGYAEASATLEVNNHSANTVTEYPANHIGLKTIKCKECSEVIETIPMTQDDLKLKELNGWGFNRYFEGDNGGYNTKGDTINGNYPEYSGGNDQTGEGMYHIWAGGEQESTSIMKMPKVDFTAFNNVSFVLHVNTTWMKIGFGYGTNDNLMPFIQRSGRTSFVLNCAYNQTTKVLKCSLNASNLECGIFEISSENIIKGSAGITLNVHFGSWASVILDSILLNHECGTMASISKSTTSLITAEKICQTCNHVSSISSNDYTYGTNDFKSNKYGLTITGTGLSVGIDEGEDVGAIKLGGGQGSVAEGEITLPRADYSSVRNVVFTFSCNAANSSIGFNTTNRIKTISNTKSSGKSLVILSYENNTLRGLILNGNGSSVTTEISDQNIIKGHEGLKLYVNLAAWNYIAVSKFTINATSAYTQSLNNELNIDNFGNGTDWGYAFNGGKWYHSIPDENDHDLTLPKVNFNYFKELIIVGAFTQGSKIGFTNDSLIYNSSGNGVIEYFVMKLSSTDDGELKGQCFIYAKCDEAGSNLHGQTLSRLSYLNFNTLIASSEKIIDNQKVYNGEENCHGLASRRLSWNGTYEIAVADLILK